MNAPLHCLEPVTVNSGDTLLDLSLHAALCRALYDLGREVPFAIRRIGISAPLVASDGDRLTCPDPDLAAWLAGGKTQRPVTAVPAHPTDPVRLTWWDMLRPEPSAPGRSVDLPLASGLTAIASAVARGVQSGMLTPATPDVSPFLLWSGADVMGDERWSEYIRQLAGSFFGGVSS